MRLVKKPPPFFLGHLDLSVIAVQGLRVCVHLCVCVVCAHMSLYIQASGESQDVRMQTY